MNVKRINKIENYLNHLKDDEKFYLGIKIDDSNRKLIEDLGFSKDIAVGESLLPPIKGPVTRFNAEGREIVRRDKPMETLYRQAWWSWEDWVGTKYSKIVDIPYKRYPRDFVSPPAVELVISENSKKDKVLLSPLLTKRSDSYPDIKHTANLFLELFGAFEFFAGNGDFIEIAKLTRLNWEVLPKGEMPWEKLKKDLDPLMQKTTKNKRHVIEFRFEDLNNRGADFVAIGRAGFSGYVIFGFKDLDLYILESMFYGNATYVLNKNWERISQLTKAEILNDSLHKERIIHREGWRLKIDDLFK